MQAAEQNSSDHYVLETIERFAIVQIYRMLLSKISNRLCLQTNIRFRNGVCLSFLDIYVYV